MNGDLAQVVDELARTNWAVELFDADWRLVWVSDELKKLLGADSDEDVGCGEHFVPARARAAWRGGSTPETAVEMVASDLRHIIRETDGGRDAVAALAGVPADALPAGDAPYMPVWSGGFDYVQPEMPPARINYLTVRLRGEGGALLGTARMYVTALPATVVSLIARGDEDMLLRMARLVEPGRRPAAVLFADLQSSGVLARRLSTPAFFGAIRAIVTAIDEVVVRHRGLVGKHVGDGVTAFFLAEDHGSESAAARAAIRAGRELDEAAAGAVQDQVDAADVSLNVGLHWGATLYMGQLVTGGRLEVSALGDEVNECARIQECARDGAVLASKAIVERLAPEDADSLAVDPHAHRYRTVADLPTAGEKAVRDAGGIAVAEL